MTYPISNRRTSFTIDYHAIRRQVGAYLEIGYSHEEWDDEQAETVDDIIRDGLHLYYNPPVLEEPYATGMTESHQWSFLRPTWTFKTQAAQRRYPLPVDFESPIGDITYPASSSSAYAPIPFTSAARLRALEYQNESQTNPEFAAVDPRESQGAGAQELDLILHPTPDAVYTLALQYQSVGRVIDSTTTFPLGGVLHGPAIMQACLAIAEFRKTGDEGPMWKQFMRLLTANIIRDRQRGARLIGYNGDNMLGNPISRGQMRRLGGLFYDTVLYGGVAYTEE
jgi:hypothetical protein